MYNDTHPAYWQLQKIGKEITQHVKPRAVVVFSAHWQANAEDTIEVNAAETTDLIYDFYNFPRKFYSEKYPHIGSQAIAGQVLDLLHAHDIKATPVSRGLDHGVWVAFKVLFDPETNPLNVPIVQVSLFAGEDPNKHYALGRAVADLRAENIAIIVSGMAVHNLRDFRLTGGVPGAEPLPYAASFDEALKEAVETEPAEREQKMAALMDRGDARQAHPTFEHLLPIYVGAGAAAEETGKQTWTRPEGSTSWAQYRFGEVA